MDNLPNDVLLEILLTLTDADEKAYFNAMEGYGQNKITICHPRLPKPGMKNCTLVCARWRDLIMRYSRFHVMSLPIKQGWYLEVQDFGKYSKWIEESQDCDIDLALEWEDDEWDELQISSAWDLVLPHASRLRYLALYLSDQLMEVLISRIPKHISMYRLRCLKLGTSENSSDYSPLHLPVTPPRLSHLFIKSKPLSRGCITSLTSLEYIETNYVDFTHLESLLGVVAHLPNTRSVHIMITIKKGMYVHEKLQLHLPEVQITCGQYWPDILNYFDPASLRILSLNMAFHQALYDPSRYSLPNLRLFRVFVTPRTFRYISPFFRSCPALESLELDLMSWWYETLETNLLLSHLKHLVIATHTDSYDCHVHILDLLDLTNLLTLNLTDDRTLPFVGYKRPYPARRTPVQLPNLLELKLDLSSNIGKVLQALAMPRLKKLSVLSYPAIPINDSSLLYTNDHLSMEHLVLHVYPKQSHIGPFLRDVNDVRILDLDFTHCNSIDTKRLLTLITDGPADTGTQDRVLLPNLLELKILICFNDDDIVADALKTFILRREELMVPLARIQVVPSYSFSEADWAWFKEHVEVLNS